MSVRRIPAAILSVLAAFPLRAFAPAADPPAITVNLTATDHKGHRIPDLTAADLTLLDDDSPQQILSLASVKLRREEAAEGEDSALRAGIFKA